MSTAGYRARGPRWGRPHWTTRTSSIWPAARCTTCGTTKKDQYKTLGYDTYSEARQFFISYSYNDYRPLNGKIAEARVWSVARTPEQIWENMYNVENPKDDPTLLGYWKFNDGKGNTVKDYSRYGNDGQAKYDLKWPDGIEIPKINEVEE